MNISLLSAKTGPFSVYGYVINIPMHIYYDNEISPLAQVIYQQLADDFGLPVLTLDTSFEPACPLDLGIVNGSEDYDSERVKDRELYTILRQGPKKVAELQKIVNKSQPTLGIRLKRMAEEGLVVKQDSAWLIPESRLKILKMIEEFEQEK